MEVTLKNAREAHKREEDRVSTIAVSARKVCRFLTSKGYYYLQSTKKDFQLRGCAKKIKILAKSELTKN